MENCLCLIKLQRVLSLQPDLKTPIEANRRRNFSIGKFHSKWPHEKPLRRDRNFCMLEIARKTPRFQNLNSCTAFTNTRLHIVKTKLLEISLWENQHKCHIVHCNFLESFELRHTVLLVNYRAVHWVGLQGVPNGAEL